MGIKVEDKNFIKSERIAFLWVNVGCVLLFIALMIWKFTPISDFVNTTCGFAELLHLYCPGCGGTRSVYAMLRLDIVTSFLYHPLIAFLVVLFVEYYVGAIITMIKNNGKRYYYLRVWFCYVALGIIVLNFVLRNVLMVFWHIDPIGDLIQYWI